MASYLDTCVTRQVELMLSGVCNIAVDHGASEYVSSLPIARLTNREKSYVVTLLNDHKSNFETIYSQLSASFFYCH